MKSPVLQRGFFNNTAKIYFAESGAAIVESATTVVVSVAFNSALAALSIESAAASIAIESSLVFVLSSVDDEHDANVKAPKTIKI